MSDLENIAKLSERRLREARSELETFEGVCLADQDAKRFRSAYARKHGRAVSAPLLGRFLVRRVRERLRNPPCRHGPEQGVLLRTRQTTFPVGTVELWRCECGVKWTRAR